MNDRAPKRNDAQTLTALRQFDSLPDSAYVKRPVVQALFGGVSDEEVRRRTRDGRIPTPTKLGSRNNIWRVGELRLALARLAEADPVAPARAPLPHEKPRRPASPDKGEPALQPRPEPPPLAAQPQPLLRSTVNADGRRRGRLVEPGAIP